MTDPDDIEARRQHAAELQAEIDRLKAGGGATSAPPADPQAESAPSSPISPREFIEKRMRQLAATPKKDG